MNADENTEIQAEKEFLEVLTKTCRTARGSRARPDLAIPAGKWEVKIKARLDEIDRILTPALPLNANKQKAVAA